ncbi:hypothetical protein [Streptomyces halobius]|uniref:hypothetical protein n=1 Tax=Streptomyces halobius TaxID=2879846 RepID=UPI0029E8113B|nr:hypothetical protein [Streptomyces halobius]
MDGRSDTETAAPLPTATPLREERGGPRPHRLRGISAPLGTPRPKPEPARPLPLTMPNARVGADGPARPGTRAT